MILSLRRDATTNDDDVKEKKKRNVRRRTVASLQRPLPPTLPRPGVGSFREDLFATTTTTIERGDV